jgi:hypothetical protein
VGLALAGSLVHGWHFATRYEAMDKVMGWLLFHDTQRLYSTLGYVSPRQSKRRWYADWLKKAV